VDAKGKLNVPGGPGGLRGHALALEHKRKAGKGSTCISLRSNLDYVLLGGEGFGNGYLLLFRKEGRGGGAWRSFADRGG